MQAASEPLILLLAGWSSGISLYLTVALLGVSGRFGWISLPGELTTLQNPLIIGASALVFAVEFVADKVPYVDSAWDSVHTFIRPIGGTAIDAIGSQTTAVILMDSHLKDPSSRKRLGAESRTQGIPLILLVDTQSESREPEAAGLQAAAVLVKPFPLAVMIDTIRGVLRTRSTTVVV